MDEVLSKRLLGALVLVAFSLLLTRILPAPHVLPEPTSPAQRVIYDLRKPQFELSAAQVEALLAPYDATRLVARWLPEPAPEAVAVTIPLASGPISGSVPAQSVAAPPRIPKTQAAAPGAINPKSEISAPKLAAREQPPENAVKAQLPAGAETLLAPATASAAGSWFVQVGVFAMEANARQSIQRLQAAGLDTRTLRLNTDAGPRQHVRAGPYVSRDQALAARARILTLGYPDARVVNAPAD